MNRSIYYDNTTELCILGETFEIFFEKPLFKGATVFVYIIVFMLAILGNIVVGIVVLTTHNTKIVTNIYIFNLAIADTMITISYVPSVSDLVLRYLSFSLMTCKIIQFLKTVSVSVSAYQLVLISLDRYKATIHPLKSRLGKSAAKKIVAVIWIGALVISAPKAVVSELLRPSPWHENCNIDVCNENWSRYEEMILYTFVLFIIQFIIPLCILVYIYVHISHVVYKRHFPGEAQDAQDSRMQKSKYKIIKMMVIIVATFTICWLPLNIFTLIWAVKNEEWRTWPKMQYVWLACNWLAVSHACYNPFIYCYMNPCYRGDCKKIICRCLCFKTDDSEDPYQRVNINEVALLSGKARMNKPSTISQETVAMADFTQLGYRRKNAHKCRNLRQTRFRVTKPSSVPNTLPAPTHADSRL